MNYRNNIYQKYNFDISGNKKYIYNTFNKKNFFPYILHKNIKNFRNKNRDSIIDCSNSNLIDCSKNCPTKINRDNNKSYYEYIYKGLDFNYENNELECYKIPKYKNRTTFGMQVPKNKLNCHTDSLNCKKNGKREIVNIKKINPYIPKFNKYENYKNKIGTNPSYLINEINHLNNENNFRYSSY